MIQNFQKFKDLFAQSKGPGYPTWKPQYGKSSADPKRSKIKVFTMPPDGGVFGKKVIKHYGLGSEGRSMTICPKTNGSQNHCPICEWIEAAHNDGDPVKVKRADAMRQSERYYIFVADIDLFEKEGKKFVGVYDAPPSIYRKIVSDMVSTDFDFTEWKSPVLEVVGYEQGQNKPKKVEIGIVMDKLSAKTIELVPSEWMSLFPKEADLVRVPTPIQLQNLLHGKEEDEEVKYEDSSSNANSGGTEKPTQAPPVDDKAAKLEELRRQLAEAEAAAKTGSPATNDAEDNIPMTHEEPKQSAPTSTGTSSEAPKKRPSLDDLLKKK